FMNMPTYDESQWLEFKNKIDAKIEPLEANKICGSDKSTEVFKTCYRHLKATNLRGIISLENQDVATYHPPVKPDLIICNPPYGKRLELNKAITFGIKQFIDRECKSTTQVYILTSEESMIRELGAEGEKIMSFKNGGLSVSLYRMRKQP
ncbi:MAG: hypothetical protein FJZ57_07500, partial [Chlamydiae bacterium]|nr:hypothetical protein [Chlamydiota bacterium]